MEEQYLNAIQPYTEGQQGKRPIDLFPIALAQLVQSMEETRADILGDVFEGAITRGQAGLFLTPEPICELMVQLTEGEGRSLYDPCCGSGRMFLAAARLYPHRLWHFVGQDIDLRCVRITAINLALWNLYGWVLHGNTLRNEVKLAYHTGFYGRGVISEVHPTNDPAIDEIIKTSQVAFKAALDNPSHQAPSQLRASGRQLGLFPEE